MLGKNNLGDAMSLSKKANDLGDMREFSVTKVFIKGTMGVFAAALITCAAIETFVVKGFEVFRK